MRGIVLAATLAASLPVSAALACAPSDIEVKQVSWSRLRAYIVVVGEILNRCTSPTGVELKLTLRDKAGGVLDTDEFWPASIGNIGTGDAYSFKWRFEDDRAAATVDVVVLRTEAW